MTSNNQSTLRRNEMVRVSSCMRFPQLKATVGLSRSTVWRLEHLGEFPRRRQISPGTVAWLREEVEAWIQQRKVI